LNPETHATKEVKLLKLFVSTLACKKKKIHPLLAFGTSHMSLIAQLKVLPIHQCEVEKK
jgi:hypothetical protein